MIVSGGSETPLSAYALAAVSGTATLTGYYVGGNGTQVGAAFSYSITSMTTLTTLAGGTLPAGAVGLAGALAGSALYVGLGGKADGTITSGMTPAAGYPQVATAPYLTFGLVA